MDFPVKYKKYSKRHHYAVKKFPHSKICQIIELNKNFENLS